MNRIVLMFLVTTLDFCLPSTGHLWPHWHHWPKIFNSTSCFPWQHYIVTLSPDVSQYFVACAFILSYLRNPLPLDTWTLGQQTLALQSCPAGIRVAWWVLRALRPRDHLHQKQYVEMGNLEECVAFDLAILGTSLQVCNSKTNHFGQAFFSLQPCCKPNIPWLSQSQTSGSRTEKSTSRCLVASCRLFCWESSSSSASWKRHSPIVIWKMA